MVEISVNNEFEGKSKGAFPALSENYPKFFLEGLTKNTKVPVGIANTSQIQV
jgi:hypothetical protein